MLKVSESVSTGKGKSRENYNNPQQWRNRDQAYSACVTENNKRLNVLGWDPCYKAHKIWGHLVTLVAFTPSWERSLYVEFTWFQLPWGAIASMWASLERKTSVWKLHGVWLQFSITINDVIVDGLECGLKNSNYLHNRVRWILMLQMWLA